MSAVQQEAERLAALGLALVPVEGKAPCSRHGAKDAVAGVVPPLAPGHGIAVCAGRSHPRLAIVDVDDLTHPICLWLLSAYPTAPRVRTGSGALHVYLLDDGPIGGTESVRWRGGEAYSVRRGDSVAVCPPSTHPETGRRYEWEVPLVDLQSVPAWAGEVARRHNLYRLSAGVSSTPEGGRQHALWQTAQQAYALDLEPEVITAELRRAAAACGLSGYQDVERQLERGREAAEAARSVGLPLDDGSDRVLAEEVIRLRGGHERVLTVGGRVWQYSECGAWGIVDDDLVRQSVYGLAGRVAGERPLTVSAAKAEGTLRAVRTLSSTPRLPGDGRGLVCGTTSVRWLPGRGLVAGEPSPAHGLTLRLDLEWDGPTATPAYDDAMATTVPHEAARELLLQWLGVTLLGQSTRLGRALRLHGPKGSGKSTWLDLVTGILGDEHVATVAPSDLGVRFGTSQITESTILCVVDEYGRDAQAKEDVWKSAVQGHAIAVERKYVDRATVQPRAGWLVAGNTWPRCPGIHDSFFQRWLIVEFPTHLRGTEDERLDCLAVLRSETAPLVRRAIQAGSRALDRGRYYGTEDSQRLVGLWMEAGDPATEWMCECCAHEGATGVMRLYQHHRRWCEEAGYRAAPRAEWYRRLLSAGAEEAWDTHRNRALRLTIKADGK